MDNCKELADLSNDNKKKVFELLKSIETGDKKALEYINHNKYIQHDLNVKDGISGFEEALSNLKKYPDPAKVNTVRIQGDDNFIVAHTEYNFFGPKIGFDIFRFEDGLIVEHWDNMQIKPATDNPGGHSMIDGPTTICDHDKTNENKTLVEQFVKDVLMGKNPEKLTEYFDGDTYIQHNPSIADGLSGLGAALANMADNGITMVYSKIHKVSGEGNFVLVVSEGMFAGKHTSY